MRWPLNKRSNASQAIQLQEEHLHWSLLRALPAAPEIVACASLPVRESAAALGRLAGEHDARRTPVVAVLSPGEYQLLLLDAPAVPREEWREAIRWQIPELIDYPVEEAVIDLFDAPESLTRQLPRVYAVVARRQRIDRIASLVADAGLRLEAVDIPELALRNLAARLPESRDGVTLLALLGNVALIALVRGETLHLARTIETATASGGAPDELADRLALEIQRTLDYHDRHFRGGRFPRLLLASQHPLLPGLLAVLEERTGLPGSELDPCRLLHCPETVRRGPHLPCLLAVAAALRGRDAETA